MFHSLRHTVSTTLSLIILASTAGLASAQSAPVPTAMRSEISIPQDWQIDPYDHPPAPADLGIATYPAPNRVSFQGRNIITLPNNNGNEVASSGLTFLHRFQDNHALRNLSLIPRTQR
jgi:hypothetical protein